VSEAHSPSIVVRDLRVAYDRDIEILRGVSITAERGAITAIIGPNGAGKSTLARAIVGLAPIISGSVELDGRDVTGLRPQDLLALGLAFVPQDRTLFPEMTVQENLQMGGWLRRRDRAWLSRRIESVLDDFPLLKERLRERAGDLSGGQQKILEIARCLISDPRALILDEPTAGLAPAMAKQVYAEIENLSTSRNLTVLLVDQNVREALTLSNRAYVLSMGRNDAEGAASDVLDRLDQIVRGWMEQEGPGVGRR
jgi:branched-chain amino acid transport system ATP-binding protein